MGYKIIVLAKQVPDTRNVGKDAMKEDGTINRAALPAIFNPEDLNALEQALQIKEQNPDTTITILTMGPPRAAEIIREAIFRGADTGIVLTDRAFAGADCPLLMLYHSRTTLEDVFLELTENEREDSSEKENLLEKQMKDNDKNQEEMVHDSDI